MEAFFLLILGVYGCVWGSFLTVVGLRLPISQPLVFARSACPNCQHVLTAKELIPVFSILHQKGRCRHCCQPISFLYPIIELTSAISLCLIYIYTGPDLFSLASSLVLLSFGIVFSVSDLTYQVLPDKIMLWFLAAVFAVHTLNSMEFFLVYLSTGIGFFFFFYLFYLFFQNGIGGGDVKCYGILGFLLGYRTCVLALLLACLLVLALHLPLLLAKKITPQHTIPFAPFIFIGAFLAYLTGPTFYGWLDLVVFIQ